MFTCFLQPRWLLNPSWSHACIGQWYKLSVSSFPKWSRFGFGDKPSIFDQSTLPFLFISDICVIYTVCSTYINSEQNTQATKNNGCIVQVQTRPNLAQLAPACPNLPKSAPTCPCLLRHASACPLFIILKYIYKFNVRNGVGAIMFNLSRTSL